MRGARNPLYEVHIASHYEYTVPGPFSDEPGGSRPVINFVIHDQAKRKLLINLHLEDVSLHDLLASLAKKYGLLVAYDDHAITVTDPKQSE